MKKSNYTKAMQNRRKGGGKPRQDDRDRSTPFTTASMHDKWLKYLDQRNYSPRTIQLYDEGNKGFIHWCEERGIQTPKEITKKTLESFQRHLHHYKKNNGEPLAISTQRKRLCILKLYFDYLCRIDFLTASPASALDIPRKPKRQLPRALSREVVKTLMGQFDINKPLGIRDRAMIELVYATAIRRTELTNIDLTDFDGTEQTLLIRKGKGGKDRLVPVAKSAVKWVEKYLSQVRPTLLVNDDEKSLFITGYGTRITPNYAGSWLTGILKSIGVEVYGSFHLLRHSCATHLVENGADIKIVQQLLGHENLETTGIYTEVAITRLKEVYHESHPSSVKNS